jgi:hypothetical protein
VVVIKVIVGGNFYVNMESYIIQIKTFLLELQYLHNAMDVSKGVRVFS